MNTEKQWWWCLHCERCYQDGDKRFGVGQVPVFEGMFLADPCPYLDCDGNQLMDRWAWDEVREDHPHYPKVPQRAVVYPLNPSRRAAA